MVGPRRDDDRILAPALQQDVSLARGPGHRGQQHIVGPRGTQFRPQCRSKRITAKMSGKARWIPYLRRCRCLIGPLTAGADGTVAPQDRLTWFRQCVDFDIEIGVDRAEYQQGLHHE